MFAMVDSWLYAEHEPYRDYTTHSPIGIPFGPDVTVEKENWDDWGRSFTSIGTE
jgi:hypothetical protein